MAEPRSIRNVITHAQSVQYTSDPSGVCAGIIQAWTDARLIHKQQEIIRLLDLIHSTDHFKKVITNSKLHSRKGISTKMNDDAFEMLALIEKIDIYHNPSKYREVFGEFLSQADIEKISQFTISEELKSLGGLKNIYSEPRFDDKESLQRYLCELAAILKQAGTSHFAINLNSTTHRMALDYDAEHNQWFLINPAHWMPEHPIAPDKIAESIMHAFKEQPKTAFNLIIWMPSKIAESKETASFVNSLTEFRTLHLKELTHKKAESEEEHKQNNSSSVSLAHAAAIGGHVDYIRVLRSIGANCDTPNQRNLTPLSYAAYLGIEPMVQELLATGCSLYKTTCNTPIETIIHFNGNMQLAIRLFLSITEENRQVNQLLARLNFENIRNKLVSAFIMYVENLPDENIKVKVLNDLIQGNNALGKLLNTPGPGYGSALSHFFSLNKNPLTNQPTTGSILKIIQHFQPLLEKNKLELKKPI